MTLSRLDLDGAGSPVALVARILELEPDLPLPIPIEDLCRDLDITSIETLHTDGFEAALVTDTVRSSGAILVAANRTPQRTRFSIAHELGHFLIPTHKIPVEGILQCSAADFARSDSRKVDFRAQMEVEANRFAAMLLIPPTILKLQLRQLREPDLSDIVRLAELFDVSKEAMARACVDHARQSLAVIAIRNGKVMRVYRNAETFPWLAVSKNDPVPAGSIWHHQPLGAGDCSEIDECDPETWLSSGEARKVEVLAEQAFGQRDGFGLILLQAEMRENEDEGLEPTDTRWR